MYRMKILMAMLATAVLSAQEMPNLSEFRMNEVDTVNVPLAEGFEGSLEAIKARGAKLAEGVEFVPNGGVNGNGAIMIQKKPGINGETPPAVFEIKGLTPGKLYRYTLDYRPEGLKDQRLFSHQVIARTDENGKQSSNWMQFRSCKNGEWNQLEYEFIAQARNFIYLPRFGAAQGGKIYLDNARVEPAAKQAEFYLSRPFKLTLAKDGAVAYKALPYGEDLSKVQYGVYAELGGKKAFARVDKDGGANLFFGDIPEGKYTIKAQLLDLDRKLILGTDEITLYRRPAAGTLIDEHGRFIVDGKPMLLVGGFSSWMERESELKQFADMGFNFMMDYTAMYLNIQPGEQTKDPAVRKAEKPHEREGGHFKYSWKSEQGRQQIKTSLDLFQKYGLKYVQGELGLALTEDYNHPAVIGKYYADEAPVTGIPARRRLREKIAGEAPLHLAMGLTNLLVDIVPYAKAFDVLGYDVYPVRTAPPEKSSMLKVREFTLEVQRSGAAGMFTPQMFNWNGYGSKDTRYPTAEELRSMVLLPALMGIKCFCFYSFTGVTVNNAAVDRQAADDFLRDAAAPAVKLLRELEPWLLSLEAAPPVKVDNRAKSMVDAAAFSAGGKVKVIITGCGPGNSEAVIRVGRDGLKSRWGHTEALGGGNYLFKGVGMCSDLLE